MFENDHTSQVNNEPIVTSDEVETDLLDIFQRADMAPLGGEDVSQLQQLLTGRDQLKEKYQSQLEKLQHREQVMRAVDAWKKLLELPTFSPFHPDASALSFQRRKKVNELEAIIDSVSDEVVFEVASDSFTMIKKGNLEVKSNPFRRRDNRYGQQQAAALERELNDIIAFAEWKNIAEDDIKKAGNEWATQDKEIRKAESLRNAQAAALAYRQLEHRTGIFTFHEGDVTPEDRTEAIRLREVISECKTQWGMTDAEINITADKWSKETLQREKSEAISEAKEALERIEELIEENEGFPLAKRDEQQAAFDEKNKLQKRLTDLKNRWRLTDQDLAVSVS